MTKENRSRLSQRQFQAIEVLLAGGTHQDAADFAGVSRSAVTSWINHDTLFMAKIEQRLKQHAARLSNVVKETLVEMLTVPMPTQDHTQPGCCHGDSETYGQGCPTRSETSLVDSDTTTKTDSPMPWRER